MDEVSKAQDTLYCLFDEIGLAKHDCEGREASLFTALNSALREQMRSVVAEKNSLVDECNKIISLIKQMERSLDDNKRSSGELRVSAPLLKCLEVLKSKQEDVKVRHAERYTAVRSKKKPPYNCHAAIF
jgi:protein regulator of cytokinesis 1